MTLFVKAKDLSGTEHTILCDDPKRALDIRNDRKATGTEAWVEDANGNRIDGCLNGMAERQRLTGESQSPGVTQAAALGGSKASLLQ